MKIDKCVKDRSLDDLNVYAGVRIFFSNNLKYDIQAVVQSPEFKTLKPRMGKLVLDQVFKFFYKKFDQVFDCVSKDFTREVLKHCHFKEFMNESKDNFDYTGCEFLK